MGSSIPDSVQQWTFGGGAKGVEIRTKAAFEGQTDKNYTLKSRDPRKFLQHEEQDVGINLGWTDDAEPSTAAKVRRWFLSRRAGSGTIKYDEPFALGNGKSPSFIRYEKRTAGINLSWSEKPVYEWRALGGTAGTPVKTGEYIGLFNDKAKEFFIYFDRTAGGDIGWPSSKTWTQQGKDRAKKAAESWIGDQFGGDDN